MRIFKKPLKFRGRKKREVPNGLWSKCPRCSQFIFNKILQENWKVCPKCNYYFPLNCWERIELLTDKGNFRELYSQMEAVDCLNFQGPKSYKQKIEEAKKSTSLKEAIVVGVTSIEGKDVAFCVTDSRFIMGSMGSVVGEKFARIVEFACKERLALIAVSGSGGGARMYEGMFSLMQMAKVSGVLTKLKEKHLPYISVLTHPTMAGVMASFAGLGDIIIAEPEALIGFTGPRVIKQTIKQELPKDFQTAEFNLQHGLVDMVVPRKSLRSTLSLLLSYLMD